MSWNQIFVELELGVRELWNLSLIVMELESEHYGVGL